MSLSKESADGLRECLRILAPGYPPEKRRAMGFNVERCIRRGAWPMFSPDDLAVLWHPRDPAKARALLADLAAARAAGELPDGSLRANDLVTWPDCPPVPPESPLRHWLPPSVHEGAARPQPAPRDPAPATPQWRELARAEAERYIARLAKHKPALFPSQEAIGDEIARLFRERGINGPDGKPLTGATIKRHALRGITSGAPRRQPTPHRRGK